MDLEPATKLSSQEDRGKPPRSSKPLLFGTVLLLTIGFVQLWIVTAGTFKGWPAYTFYYHQLADSFAHGQLSLRAKPSATLLALPDPYDPRANEPYRLHDAVLFNGKYYLYWGPVPALIVAAGFAALHKAVPPFGDQYLVFPFAFGTVALVTILIFQIRRRLFPRQPFWTAAFPIISLGLGTPLLFTLARSAVYESAIAAGQFFLIGGLLFLWLALHGPKIKPVNLILAGVSFALSVGSRASLAIAVVAVTALALWRMWQIRRNFQQLMVSAAGLLIPLLIGAALLAWYNYARFHSITEFGLRYQLAYRNQNKQSAEFSSPAYIPLNLFRYLFSTPTPQRTFPFFTAKSGMPRYAEWFSLPGSFGFESVVGLVWSQPLLLLGPVALVTPCWRRMNQGAPLADRAATVWLTITLAAAAVLGFAPSLTIEGSTMRYLLDTVPACTVLAALGFWWLLERLPKTAALRLEAISVVVALATSIMGILLGASGYYNHFAEFNPSLNNFLGSFFHL